jgi:hypothetical protein
VIVNLEFIRPVGAGRRDLRIGGRVVGHPVGHRRRPLPLVVGLYRTVVAYVEAKSVVTAAIHAEVIAVVRQIITFNPDEYGLTEAITVAGVYDLLLVALLVGFYVVHREGDEEVE